MYLVKVLGQKERVMLSFPRILKYSKIIISWFLNFKKLSYYILHVVLLSNLSHITFLSQYCLMEKKGHIYTFSCCMKERM